MNDRTPNWENYLPKPDPTQDRTGAVAIVRQKVNRMAAFLCLVMACLIGATVAHSPEAQADTIPAYGYIANRSSDSMRPVPYIIVSVTYPLAPAHKVWPGVISNARGFISGWPCYSPWGYRYKAATWYKLYTTKILALNCKNS